MNEVNEMKVFYKAVSPDEALKIVKNGSIYLPTAGRSRRNRGTCVAADEYSAYQWGLQLSYERGWDFPVILKLTVPSNHIKQEEQDPFALFIPAGVNSIFLVIKDDYIGENGHYSPHSIEIVFPTEEDELLTVLEEVREHVYRGGWSEDIPYYDYEEDEESDEDGSEDEEMVRYSIIQNALAVKETFRKLMGGKINEAWWVKIEEEAKELERRLKEKGKLSDDDVVGSELRKNLEHVVDSLIVVLMRRLREKCWI